MGFCVQIGIQWTQKILHHKLSFPISMLVFCIFSTDLEYIIMPLEKNATVHYNLNQHVVRCWTEMI